MNLTIHVDIITFCKTNEIKNMFYILTIFFSVRLKGYLENRTERT